VGHPVGGISVRFQFKIFIEKSILYGIASIHFQLCNISISLATLAAAGFWTATFILLESQMVI